MPVPLHCLVVDAVTALSAMTRTLQNGSGFVSRHPRVFGERPGHEVVTFKSGEQEKDIRIGYMVFGNGADKLVFVHGLKGTPYLMQFLPVLAAKLGATIYAFYVPGHGPSTPTRSFAEATEWLAQAARELGLIGVPWIGHSLGGLLATYVADRYPDLVSHLGTMGMPTQHPKRPSGYKARVGLVIADVIASSIAAVATAPSPSEALVLARLMAHTLVDPFEIDHAVGVLFGAPRDLREALARIHDRGIPQLHMQGLLDLPVWVSHGHRRLPGQIVRVFWSHNAPVMPRACSAIVEMVCRLLDQESQVPLLQPVPAT